MAWIFRTADMDVEDQGGPDNPRHVGFKQLGRLEVFVETCNEVSVVSMGKVLCGELVSPSVDRREERNRARACVDICS